MTAPTFALVCTTIGDGAFLDVYARKVTEEALEDRVTVYVIGDRKTPGALWDAAARANRAGLRVVCPTLDAQDAFLRALGPVHGVVPWNSETRRNVGYLMAYEAGADVIVSIDDDNLCELAGPWFAEHGVVAEPPRRREVVSRARGWWNPCEQLELVPRLVWPRGLPFAERGLPDGVRETLVEEDAVRVDVNAGLWLGAPDVDAFTLLDGPIEATAFGGRSVVLAADTWAPINTQNTAIRREAMAAWWCVRMGAELDGLRLERFGDILGGYLLLACARQVGGRVRFGTPLVMHRRNVHDVGRDALLELPGVWLVEELAPWLREAVQIDGASYGEAYASLSEALEARAAAATGRVWTASVRAFVRSVARDMRAWLSAVRTIDR